MLTLLLNTYDDVSFFLIAIADNCKYQCKKYLLTSSVSSYFHYSACAKDSFKDSLQKEEIIFHILKYILKGTSLTFHNQC